MDVGVLVGNSFTPYEFSMQFQAVPRQTTSHCRVLYRISHHLALHWPLRLWSLLSSLKSPEWIIMSIITIHQHHHYHHHYHHHFVIFVIIIIANSVGLLESMISWNFELGWYLRFCTSIKLESTITDSRWILFWKNTLYNYYRHALDGLEKKLHRINEEIQLKSNSLKLDKQCLDSRAKLTGGRVKSCTEKNMLLTGVTRERSQILAY